MEFLTRTTQLFGENNIKTLQNSKVIIFGVGGVGGYVLEMLTRTGIGNIAIVDFDVIDISNVNRQIISTQNNVGNLKVEEAKKRVLEINPNCKIEIFADKVCSNNVHQFLNTKYDYVVDCIDSVSCKMDLIEYCYKNNINIISSMGAGNKTDIPHYEISDIFKTEYDKLAKVIRKHCKERNIKKLKVCYSKEKQISSNSVGSVAYHPASCGIIIASYVVNQLIKGEI